MHLAGRAEHGEKCTTRTCQAVCGWRRFHDWLDAPLLPSDVRRDELIRERRKALLRGEIPA